MRTNPARALTILTMGLSLVGSLALAGGSVAGAAGSDANTDFGHVAPAFHVTTVLAGSLLHHSFIPVGSAVRRSESLSHPDDISSSVTTSSSASRTASGRRVRPSPDGNQDSTIVEMNLAGRSVGQWDVVGKTDGVTADPALGGVIATVNEDANSALYVIRPCTAAAVTRFAYNNDNGVLPHGGGTDAISIHDGQIFISASAPGTIGAPAPQPTYPAVYSVALDWKTQVATLGALSSTKTRRPP